MEVKTRSAYQTHQIAKKIANTLKGGETIALYGDLGAGKTIFVQALAKSLGVKTRVLSPTFVILRSYPIMIQAKKLTFHHLDLYRSEADDFTNLGLEELFNSDTIVAVEWAEKIKKFLPKKRIDISIKSLSENERLFKIDRRV